MLKLPARPRLGECLLRDGLISETELEDALASQRERASNGGGRLGECLVDLGLLPRGELLRGPLPGGGLRMSTRCSCSSLANMATSRPLSSAIGSAASSIENSLKLITTFASPVTTGASS